MKTEFAIRVETFLNLFSVWMESENTQYNKPNIEISFFILLIKRFCDTKKEFTEIWIQSVRDIFIQRNN